MSKQLDVKKLLVNKGLRVTDARTTVLQILSSSEKPLDVAEIETQLAHQGVNANEVTIYRMLDAFVEKGLVDRLDFQEGKFRYEMAKADHHHLICDHCGTVKEVTDCSIDEMEKSIIEKQKFALHRHALEFFGLCPRCQ